MQIKALVYSVLAGACLAFPSGLKVGQWAPATKVDLRGYFFDYINRWWFS